MSDKIDRTIYDIRNIKAGSPFITVTVLPSDLQSGDVMFMSPSGEVRRQPALRWYQRLWNRIDERVRKWIY